MIEDIDQDGRVALSDLLPLIDHLRTPANEPRGESRLDLNGDKRVTLADLLIVVRALRGAHFAAEKPGILSPARSDGRQAGNGDGAAHVRDHLFASGALGDLFDPFLDSEED